MLAEFVIDSHKKDQQIVIERNLCIKILDLL